MTGQAFSAEVADPTPQTRLPLADRRVNRTLSACILSA